MTNRSSLEIPTHLLPDGHERGIVVVYDGECPFCSRFVDYAKLRSAFDQVFLLDAREHHELTDALQHDGIDLDHDMVLIHDGEIHPGPDAIQFLANHSVYLDTPSEFFFKAFKGGAFSRRLYPILRAGRRLTLTLLGIDKINSGSRQ